MDERVETPLARLLREQGRKKGWIAFQMGIGYDRLTGLLSGERAMTLVEASRAAVALGVSIEAFLPSAETRVPSSETRGGEE